MGKELTLGSLFSGSGGFELAGALADIRPVWASEIEPFAIRVTTKRLPSVIHYGDVSSIKGADVPSVDILTWGSPCQDLSVSGKRAGLSGARSGLYVQAVRIAREMLEATAGEYPKYCVFENVPGLLSSNAGEDYKACLDMMQEIGFLPDPNILDAQHMGVAQRRKRVYITWINARRLIRQATPITDAVVLQLLAELLMATLADVLLRLGASPRGLGSKPVEDLADERQRRAKLFDLNGEGAGIVQERASAIARHTASTIPTVVQLEDILEEGGTRAGILDAVARLGSGSALLLVDALKIALPHPRRRNLNKWAADCLGMLYIVLEAVRGELQLMEKHAFAVSAYEWAPPMFKTLEGYVNEGKKHLRGDGGMEWDGFVRIYKQGLSALSQDVAGYLGDKRRREVLPFANGMPWDCPQGGRTGEEDTGTAQAFPDATSWPCLNDQGGERMCVSIGVTGTLRAQQHGHEPIVAAPSREPIPRVEAFGITSYHSHAMLSDNPDAGIYRASTAKTLDRMCGHPGCHQGGIAVVEEKGGAPIYHVGHGSHNTHFSGEKVAETLLATDWKMPTVVAVPAVGCWDIRFMSDGTKNARGHCYQTDISRCLSTAAQDPDGNHGGICILEPIAFAQNQRNEVRDLDGRAGTICAHGGMKQQTYVLQGSLVGRGEDSGPQGTGVSEDAVYTLNTVDRHAVASPPNYIVRRLTPTECARLQGFPDWWCAELETPEPTEEELDFWMGVFETHRRIVTGAKQPRSRKQVAAWLRHPYTDAAEYKLWGNGIALPCALLVMDGIMMHEALIRRPAAEDCQTSAMDTDTT